MQKIPTTKKENAKLKQDNEKLVLESQKYAKLCVGEEKFKEMSENLLTKIQDLENKFVEKFDSGNEQITSVNATCVLLEHKIDVLNKDCVSKAFFRQP